MNFHIIEELKSFITPLSGEELFTLKENILSEGCREPLVVWLKTDQERILIDGHNRYTICTSHNIPFKTRELRFKNLEAVKDWMVDNQLGRRNLNPDQLSYYRGLKYERLKKSRGGYDKVLSKGHSGPLTAEILAKEFNVSEKTIKRDSQYSRGIDRIGAKNQELKVQILAGEIKFRKNDIQYLGSVETPPNRKFKNSADLFNIIQNLKKEDQNIKVKHALEVEKERLLKAQKLLEERDQLFKSTEEQIERSKARIISQINTCIKNKDSRSFNELSKLLASFKELVLRMD